MKQITITYDSTFVTIPDSPDTFRLDHIAYSAESGRVWTETIATGLSATLAKADRQAMNRMAARMERSDVYVTPPHVGAWLKDAVEKLTIGNPPFVAEGAD